MKKKIFFLLLIINAIMYCADIGSDTAVTRFNSQVIINNGDRVAGFAALFGGFALVDANAIGTFDSFFPVSGSISLTGGTLILNRDLIFHDVVSIGFLGNIIGNRHAIEIPTIDRIPSEGGANFRCSPYFITQINVGADAETLSWSFDERYLITFSDDGLLRLYELINDTLVFGTSIGTGGIAIDGVGQVAWRPDEYIIGLAREGGGGTASVRTFSYDVGTNTLTAISNITLAADGRACAWHPSGDFLAVGSSVTTGEIRIYPVDGSGVIDGAGVVTFNVTPDRIVAYESIAWNTTGDYLVVGLAADGGVSPEIVVLEVTTSPLSIVGINASFTQNRSVGGLDWGKGPDYLVVGLVGTTGDNIQVYSFDNGGGGVGVGTLTLEDSVSDLGRTTEGVSWEASGECFSASTDELAGTAFFNTYAFDGSSLDLISNIIFTGLAAGDDFEATRWGPLGQYAAVSGDDNIIRVYALPAGTCYTWSNVLINEVSNTTYHDLCITFTGENIWAGFGSCIEFESTCTFFIEANASLMFRDMSLIGLGSAQIIPLDSTSTLSFNNIDVVLENDYTFNIGRFDIIDDVRVLGEGKNFILTTTTACHINSDSRFIFEKDTIFRYAPVDGSSRNLLILDDTTAQLVFDSATLSTSSAGLQITKGKIMFDGLCMIINEGNSGATSLELGDGVSVANNVTVRWLPACNVELIQGELRMNNV